MSTLIVKECAACHKPTLVKPSRLLSGHGRFCSKPCRSAHSASMPAVVERFWKKVTTGPASECWEWQGAISVSGYGTMWNKDSRGHCWLAHRVSWAIANNSSIPDSSLAVCHSCDNRKCVNPSHLFLGTWQDNLADMRAKGRGSPPPRLIGENNPETPFTTADVLSIRARVASGESQSAIGREFGVSSNAINAIVHRRSWTHI